MDEGHFDHSGEVDGGFFKAGEDAAAFFQPADQSFHNVALAVAGFVEVYRPCVSVFIGLRGDHGSDLQFQKHLVDPVRSISFVAGDGGGPGHELAITGRQFVVDAVEQIDERRVFVSLTGREFKVNRTTVGLAHQMNLRGKTAARPA